MSLALEPLGRLDFEGYRRYVIEHYAREKVESGQWPSSGALRRSEKEVGSLLPDGPVTSGHCFYSIRDGSEAVGTVWIHIREENGRTLSWIYDLVISEDFRGKDYGSRALSTVESKAKELGAEEMGLHVFAHNKAAISLYEKSDYEATSIVMAKSLQR